MVASKLIESSSGCERTLGTKSEPKKSHRASKPREKISVFLASGIVNGCVRPSNSGAHHGMLLGMLIVNSKPVLRIEEYSKSDNLTTRWSPSRKTKILLGLMSPCIARTVAKSARTIPQWRDAGTNIRPA